MRPLDWLVCVLLTALLLVSSTARAATTLAVLPLEKGAAGPELEGLGTALAGMLISDLSDAEGLVLVERSRLDAVLAEIELGEKGYLDAATAQRLGRGLGAELVLVGSYSVVDGTLALDARLVAVESGAIVHAVDAQGPVADFVTVEKDLAEQVVSAAGSSLDARARRTFYSRVPTEDWGAFTAWSKGQALADEGALEEARAAFQAALARDPGFQAALEGLTALRAALETARSRNREARDARTRQGHEEVLANTVDVRTLPAGPPPEDAVRGLPVRWAVLHEQGAHCQRMAEMEAFLDRVDWRPESVVDGWSPRFSRQAAERAEALGWSPWPRQQVHPDDAVYDSLYTRDINLFTGTARFLFHDLDRLVDQDDAGMATSLLACHDPDAQGRILRRWEKRLDRHGLLDEPAVARQPDGLTVGQHLRVLRAWGTARVGRLPAEVVRPLEALLAAHPDDQDPRNASLVNHLDRIEREADLEDRRRVGWLGSTPDALWRRLEAIDEASAPVDLDRQPWCRELYDTRWAQQARRLRERWSEVRAKASEPIHMTRETAKLMRVMEGVGCFADVEPRYTSFEQARDALVTARTRTHPVHGDETHCDPLVRSLEGLLAAGPSMPTGLVLSLALENHYALIQARCLLEAP